MPRTPSRSIAGASQPTARAAKPRTSASASTAKKAPKAGATTKSGRTPVPVAGRRRAAAPAATSTTAAAPAATPKTTPKATSKATPKATPTAAPIAKSPARSAKPAAPVRPLLAPRSALIEALRLLPGVTEDIKWQDNDVLSVGGKMFAIFDIDRPGCFAFKCDDADFETLTERDGVIPAPYAAKFGWVKVARPGALPASEAKRLLRKAYGLILERLPARRRAAIEAGIWQPPTARKC